MSPFFDQEPQLAAFRAWFLEYDADGWGKKFEGDVAAGRFDALEDEAVRDLREGCCSPLNMPN
jgi:hypothetical protein